MSFNFHAISKFRDSEAIFAAKWTNIANSIKNINDYLAVENDFIVGEIKKDASKFSKKRSIREYLDGNEEEYFSR